MPICAWYRVRYTVHMRAGCSGDPTKRLCPDSRKVKTICAEAHIVKGKEHLFGQIGPFGGSKNVPVAKLGTLVQCAVAPLTEEHGVCAWTHARAGLEPGASRFSTLRLNHPTLLGGPYKASLPGLQESEDLCLVQ
jgi:hypothetical protein